MNLKSHIAKIDDDICKFIKKNHPGFVQYGNGSWGVRHDTILNIRYEHTITNETCLGWVVELIKEDSTSVEGAMNELKSFMRYFKYKPIYDPKLTLNGRYETGSLSDGTSVYAKCWIIPNLPRRNYGK